MRLVASSSSITSPKVFDRNNIFFPSWDQSARSPNHVTCVMCGGKWSAGLSPSFGARSSAAPSRAAARARPSVTATRFVFIAGFWLIEVSLLEDCLREIQFVDHPFVADEIDFAALIGAKGSNALR